MGERLRGHHAASWAAIGAAGGAIVVASLLPAIRIGIGGFVGAGATQRSFRYEAEASFAGDLRPYGLVPLVVGLLLVGGAVLGILRGSRPWLVAGAFALAVVLGLFVLWSSEQIVWTDGGVIGYESPQLLVQPALDELQDEARRSPEARNPGWELSGGEHGYAARGLAGWHVLPYAALALLWLTGYRLARLFLRPWASVWLVIGTTAFVLVWLVFRALSRSE
jgi:hypothetical protein